MKLTPPTMIVFWICVALGVIGLVTFLVPTLGLAAYAFWFEFVGLALLIVALLVKGL